MALDTLNFSEQGVKTGVELMNEVIGKTNQIITEFDNYISSYIVPELTTSGSVQKIQKLQNFSTTELRSFLTDLQREKEKLANTSPHLSNIQQA